MIKINLLPYRAWKKRREKKRLFFVLITTILVSSLVSAALYLQFKKELYEKKAELKRIESEISNYSKVVAEVNKLKRTKKTIEKKIAAIKSLRAKRAVSPYILYSIARKMPDGEIWLKRLTRSGKNLEMVGFCSDETYLSRLLRNLKTAKIFKGVKLKSMKRGGEGQPFEFDIVLEFTR